jgi:DNA-binding NarL/FixJ family response regulator
MDLPRMILADDHTILLESLRTLLQGRCEIVGTVSDGRALLNEAPALKPDIIVIDIGMPELNGLEAGRRLKKLLPEAKLIFLTMNEDPDMAAAAMRCGASAYLLKKSAASELFRAIQDALKGKSYVTPSIARGMKESFIKNPAGKARRKTLSNREREVMQLLAEGKSMKQAANSLNVSTRTVAFHKYHIMEQLGLKTGAELIHFAIKNRILVI